MHCPLCKAQYRAGYGLCRGCDADLVLTKEQADGEDVVLFLESANLTGIGELADALKEANVPNYSRFGEGKAKAPLIGLFAQAKAARNSLGESLYWNPILSRQDKLPLCAICKEPTNMGVRGNVRRLA